MTRPTPCQQCKADLADAKELIEALTAGRDAWRSSAEARGKRIEELEREQLMAKGVIGGLVAERDEARGEVKRWRKHFDETALDAAKLASANALLVRWVKAPEITQHVYLAGEADMNLGADTSAHLSGQPAAPSLPAVGSKWRSLTTRPGSVWTVRVANSTNIYLTEDGPEDASRACARHLFSNHYEPAVPLWPCPRTYPLDPNTAEDPCEDCGRDERKHEIGARG